MSISALGKFSVVTLMMMIFIIPQSYFELKLPILGMILVWFFVRFLRGHWKIRSKAFFPYYLIFCFLSIVWSLIGLAKDSSEVAIVESLRVYVVYMAIYCVLTICISNINYQPYVDGVVVAGGLGVGLVALVTLVDQILQMDLLPQFVKDDMFLQVGFHDGYLQMNNVNIGMLAFIVPYLISRLMLSDRKDRNAYIAVGLVVSVSAAIAASRRVVMVLIFIAPMLIYAINFLTDQPNTRHWRRWNRAYFLFLLTIGLCIGMVSCLGVDFLEIGGFVGRFMNAFDTDPDSPRPLQHTALVAGLFDNFFWGSGFGGVVDVVRSDERPWTFELTYSRLLFNGGLIGFGLVLLFYFGYLILVLQKIRQDFHAPIYISLLTGFLSVSIAAASNPYLSSFDFLFALSIIPLILNSKDQPESNQLHE